MAAASRRIHSSTRQAQTPFYEMSGRKGFIWHDLHAGHRARARAGNLGSSTAYHLHLSLSKLSSVPIMSAGFECVRELAAGLI